MTEKSVFEMDEKIYMSFYKETVLGYSRKNQKAIRNLLNSNGAITFDKEGI